MALDNTVKGFKAGIVDFEVYLPEKFITAEELAPQVNIPADVLKEKFGFNRKTLGGPDDHSVAMATKAAKRLLERTKIDPSEIDLIIYPGEEVKEYFCYTGAIKIQHELGISNEKCWSFDLSYRCAATGLALKVAKEMLMCNDDINTILLAGGNENGDLIMYDDPNSSFMFDMCPSGHAAIIKKNYDKNLILGSGIHVEPDMCDDVVGLYWGTKNKIPKDVYESDNYARVYVTDPPGMKKRLAAAGLKCWTKTVDIALKNSGLNREDIDFFSNVHIKPSAHKAIMRELGIAEGKDEYLQEYGHTGHTDQWLSLQLGIESGKVKAGTNVCFLGAGTGYAYTSTMIRWG